MALRRSWLALAVALVATLPLSLSAQGAAKGDTGKKAAASAQKNATPPATTAAATPKESAKCKDGTMYSGASRQGACSSHGGVAEWLPKGTTAKCNDGTYYTKAERQGACSGHKGVAEWLKKS